MTANESPGLLLNGLDGSSPLGFLAAVGVLRTVAEADSCVDWRVRWELREGNWSPVLLGDATLAADGLIEMLMPALRRMKGHPALSFADDLTLSCADFRRVALSACNAADPSDRRHADFMAAFGCDSHPISPKDPRIQDTALRTMSGAGHQHFIGSMRELVQETDAAHLRASLFEAWQYADPKPSLRWDPVDDRRYALRWRAPSGDPVRTMRGANRLAVEALPLFPTAPGERRLETTGFAQRRGQGVLFTWPIWEGPLNIDTLRSLLGMAELQEPRPDREILRARGVVEIYRSQRITEGKYRNFTPALPA